MEAADCASPPESESRALGRAAFRQIAGLYSGEEFPAITNAYAGVFDELMALVLVR